MTHISTASASHIPHQTDAEGNQITEQMLDDTASFASKTTESEGLLTDVETMNEIDRRKFRSLTSDNMDS